MQIHTVINQAGHHYDSGALLEDTWLWLIDLTHLALKADPHFEVRLCCAIASFCLVIVCLSVRNVFSQLIVNFTEYRGNNPLWFCVVDCSVLLNANLSCFHCPCREPWPSWLHQWVWVWPLHPAWHLQPPLQSVVQLHSGERPRDTGQHAVVLFSVTINHKEGLLSQFHSIFHNPHRLVLWGC